MAKFQWDCPHEACRTMKAYFSTSAAHVIPGDQLVTLIGHCGICRRLTMFYVAVVPFEQASAAANLLQTSDDIFMEHASGIRQANRILGLKIVETLPKDPTPDVPAHVPENVATSYREGLKALDSGLWEPAAFSVRKSLERAVRHFVPDGNDGLKSRIRRLSSAQQIPPAMIDLAHTVRAEGNVAVHEENWTKEEAHQLAHFARLLFIYIFTLPQQVKAVASERGAPADKR